MDYIFIVNPKSRTGQGELLWSQLEPELKKRRVSYEVRMTGRKKDAERIATEITADEEEHTMIVLGGDGSLNEVINGIKNPSKVTLGYIPTGSEKSFFADHPVSPESAFWSLTQAPGRIACVSRHISHREWTFQLLHAAQC